MKRILSPRVMLALSMTAFGTLAPFVRAVPISSGALALWRAVLAVATISLLLLVGRRGFPLGRIKAALPLLLLSGGAMGFNWILLFEAYRYTSVSVATLSYYFAPVLVTVVSPLLFRERLTRRQLLCFAMATVGLVLVTGGGALARRDLIGVLLGLGAACLYASVILLNKCIRGVTGIHRTLLQFLAAIAVLLPYVLLTGSPSLAGLGGVGWACLLTVGILHTGVTYCLYFSALKELPGQETALLSYIDPLVAILISVTVLHEPLTLPRLIGGAMILGFTLCAELTPQGKR